MLDAFTSVIPVKPKKGRENVSEDTRRMDELNPEIEMRVTCKQCGAVRYPFLSYLREHGGSQNYICMTCSDEQRV